MRTTRTRVVVGGLIIVAVLAGAATRFGGGNPFVGEAIAALSDDARFTTATDAGATFARVASLLLDAGEDCEGERCDRFFTASAFAQVTAVQVLGCTRPGIFQARRSMRTYLESLEEADEPEPPRPVSCD